MDILTRQIEKAKKEFDDKFGHWEMYITHPTTLSPWEADKNKLKDHLEQSIRESVIAVVSSLRMKERELDFEEAEKIDKESEGIVSYHEVISIQRGHMEPYNQAVEELNSKIDNICKK